MILLSSNRQITEKVSRQLSKKLINYLWDRVEPIPEESGNENLVYVLDLEVINHPAVVENQQVIEYTGDLVNQRAFALVVDKPVNARILIVANGKEAKMMFGDEY